MKAIIISVVCLLIGCANSPIVIANMNPEELRSVDSNKLCVAYVHPFHTNEEIGDELRSRGIEVVRDLSVQGGYSIMAAVNRCRKAIN